MTLKFGGYLAFGGGNQLLEEEIKREVYLKNMKKKFNMKLGNNALEVLQKRYLMGDETPDDMCDRVATKIASAEKTEELKEHWYQEFKLVLIESLFSPNSPTWRNAGANQGNLSACFYLDIEDSRKSIFKVLGYSVEIQAFGGGTGHNFSWIRPENSIIKTTMGRASGPIGFAKVFNFVVGEVIQQGGVRKGAQMALLEINHPDIEKFINCKQTEGDLNNFNISVIIPEWFMNNLIQNDQFVFDTVFDGRSYKKLRGKDIWAKLIKGAWKNGEPGILFIDTVNNLSPTFPYQIMRGCNPCGEQILGNMESCNLGSIDLSKFVHTHIPGIGCLEPTGTESTQIIDFKRLREVIRIAVRFLDNVIDVNNYPIPEIEIETKKFRKIGLGVMGWADLLIKLQISYNSPEALELAEKVMKFINDEATKYSEELLQEKGHGTWEGFLDPSIYAKDRTNPLFRRRNATLTTIAPTGTLSLIAGCSSGIEPVFSFEFKKKCLDGEMVVRHPLFQEWVDNEIKGGGKFRKPNYFVEANDVPVEQHVHMQAAFQKHVHNAVSKTINAPYSSTIEDVDQAFKLAYTLGCKGLTFYRDGSREFQAQTAVREETKQAGQPSEFDHSADAIKYLTIPEAKKLAEDILMKAESERSADPFSELQTPTWLPGWREKVKTGSGTLWVHVFVDPDTGFREVWTAVSKPGRDMAAAADSTGRLITLALKHGASWDEIVKQLQGHIGERTVWDNGVQIMSIQDGTAKVIRKRCVDNILPNFICPFNKKCQQRDSHEVLETQCQKANDPSADPNYFISTKEMKYPNYDSKKYDLCPDCASLLIHDEGCKGGRCLSCGWSNCS